MNLETLLALPRNLKKTFFVIHDILLIVTKLDGTAKGGILAALASDRPVPVRYIGVGEGIDDLRPFDARAFVDALLD